MFAFIKNIPTHMDYEGQHKAERIFQTIILLAAIVGLGLGFTQERFSYTVYSLGVGFIFSAVLTLPPWPMYRMKPLKWQPSVIIALEEKAAKQAKKNKAANSTK